MGIYLVTGGTHGIGTAAAEELRAQGHEVYVTGTRKGDFVVNLSDRAERHAFIAAVHERFPDGIDGLICNAGVAGVNAKRISDIITVNYFGCIEVAEGCLDLLEKKHGSCAITVSGSLAFYKRGKYDITELLNYDPDEERIVRLIDTFQEPFIAANQLYIASKFSLVRWMRATAPDWARRGVHLNAAAPGCCETNITKDMPQDAFEQYVLGLPMACYYEAACRQPATDLGKMLAFLVGPGASGLVGQTVFCDGGVDCLVGKTLFDK